MSTRIFGEIPEVREGAEFINRKALGDAGVHRPRQAGISGSSREGCDSIIISGGYIDDEDYGNRIIYTGHGGNDGGRQVAHQELKRGNLALAMSCDSGLPVRVVRGAKGDPNHSPASGYRYSGIFFVNRYWPDTGKDGYRIWRFELQKSEFISGGPGALQETRREPVRTQRMIRSTALGNQVKTLHNHICQLCREVLRTPAGFYAEAAHIKPLGSPHNGPDTMNNILCLCPNCHVRFDRLVVSVDQRGRIKHYTDAHSDKNRIIRIVKDHAVAAEYLEEHRQRCELASIDANESS